MASETMSLAVAVGTGSWDCGCALEVKAEAGSWVLCGYTLRNRVDLRVDCGRARKRRNHNFQAFVLASWKVVSLWLGMGDWAAAARQTFFIWGVVGLDVLIGLWLRALWWWGWMTGRRLRRGPRT